MAIGCIKLRSGSLARAVFLIVGLVAVGATNAVANEIPAPLARALKRYGLSRDGLSVYVHVMGEAKPLLTIAPDVPRSPASVLKLVPTLAALEELGPAYQWKTEVYSSRPIIDGRLEGDLYLKGYGDPYLVIEQFWRLLRAVRQSGLDTIAGDLVFDQGYFADEPGDPGEFDGQALRAYNALPRALLVNFQAVQIRLLPQAPILRIVADPPVAVENRIKLIGGPCHGGRHGWSMRVLNGKQTRLLFNGNYAAACGEGGVFRVLSQAGPYLHGVFQALWLEQGGRLRGNWREAPTPSDAVLLHTFQSPPLSEVVRMINKYSNNVMTRQLLLTLGAERHGAPATTEKGGHAVQEWLQRRGLNFPELILDNGSGLSRTARISARSLGRLLQAGFNSQYMPEFVSALPLSAQDGTLANRFGGALAGRMHLKTGSLNGVRSLAGYVLDASGRRVVVVYIYNDPRANSAAAEVVQRVLLEWVHNREAARDIDIESLPDVVTDE